MRVGRSKTMIVRKYCERKRARMGIFAKEKNKKDLMEPFRTEAAGES